MSLVDPGIDQSGGGLADDNDQTPAAPSTITPGIAAIQRTLEHKRAALAREREAESPPASMALDRAMADARQMASMAGEPFNAGPGDLARFARPGHRQFRDALSDGQRSRFDALSTGKRALILEPHASRFDPALMPMAVREIESARDAATIEIASETTEDLVRRVGSGDAGSVATLAEALCQGFGGGPEDRRRWGAIHSLGGQLHRGEVSVDAVLDSLRQSRNPECERPGAVFTTALKGHGWRPS